MEVAPPETVIFGGEDRMQPSFGCGQCGARLIVGTPPEAVANVLLKCNRCGAINEPPPLA